MSYTQAQARAFVLNAVISGAVSPEQLIAEGWEMGIGQQELTQAATDLREAGWIEWQAPYYHICPQGLICRRLLPPAPIACEVEVLAVRVSETGVVEYCRDKDGEYSVLYAAGKQIQIRDKGVK